MKRVIIIEDDPIAALGYQRLLRAHNFEVDIARDGVAGLERLGQVGADAILLDMMLPKLNGLEVLRAIRAHEACCHLPILVLTAAAVPTVVEQALQAGANCVFDKSNDNALAVVGVLHDILQTTSDASLVGLTKTGNPDSVLDYWPVRNGTWRRAGKSTPVTE